MSKDDSVTAINRIFLGEVSSAQTYGAFVSIPGTPSKGLVHKSQISNVPVPDATEVLNRGDRVWCKIIGANDEGKISLSMKVVNQGNGRDLDPNGVIIQQDENRRKSWVPQDRKRAIVLEAVLNTKCSKCGTSGHLSKDCFQVPGGKTYELLPEIESKPVPQADVTPVDNIMESIDIKTQEKIRKKMKKEEKKLKKKNKMAKKLKKQKKKIKKEKKTKKKKKHKESFDSSSSSSSSSSLSDDDADDKRRQSRNIERSSTGKSAHHRSTGKRVRSPPRRNAEGDHNAVKKEKHQPHDGENATKEKQLFSFGSERKGQSPSSSRKSIDHRMARDRKSEVVCEKKPHVRTGWSSSPESPRPRKKSASPEFRRQMSRNPCQSSRR